MSAGGIPVATLAAALALAAGAEPPCRVSVELEPARAYVEQQVIYRLRTLRHESVSEVHWVEPLAFPSFRAEWLPGRSPDRRVSEVGSHRLVFEERRALFPARVGRLEIPPARLLCEIAEAAGRRGQEVVVPGAQLEVLPLPGAGRPADFAGVVGAVSVRSRVPPTGHRLGRSIPLTVTVRGSANVWRAPSPLEALEALADTEVFALRPELSFEAGARLAASQTYSFELVAHRAGPLTIPAMRVAYFDPDRRRYGWAEAPSIELVVEAGTEAPASGATERPPERGASTSSGAGGRAHPRWRSRAARAAIAAALALGALHALRRRLLPPGVRPELAEAARARRRGDRRGEADAVARALRKGLATRVRDAPGLTAEELLANPRLAGPARAAAELLVALDRFRFGAGEGAMAPTQGPPCPSPARVRALLRALGRRS